ncbi:MAG: dTDP-6-deoxy-L-hexose 3-O-methyltransferase [Rhodospirillaceae bacterium]|nr:dTDP-6-deoxy-L-hexose 3-O-methyltransferase [Rhodospirillaceae bacterium]|tara:strand:- start:941 stop:1591 length:651 start_codon:yes stop_codon:yes gene_type:complete
MVEDLSLENEFYLNVTPKRLSKLITRLDLYRKIINLRGEIIECGVFKGSSLMQFIKLRSIIETPFSRKIIAFDTFGEFPCANYNGDKKVLDSFIKEAGNNSISEGKILQKLKDLKIEDNIELIKGNLLDTAHTYLCKNPGLKISLLHIDVDLYESTKCVLENFFPYVVKGGVVILDDYGAFPGANKAIDEYFDKNSIAIKQLPNSNSISYIVKGSY